LRQASVEGVTAAVPIAQGPETAAKTDRHKLEKRASPFSFPTLSTPSVKSEKPQAEHMSSGEA
jgi:hypothetical protein